MTNKELEELKQVKKYTLIKQFSNDKLIIVSTKDSCIKLFNGTRYFFHHERYAHCQFNGYEIVKDSNNIEELLDEIVINEKICDSDFVKTNNKKALLKLGNVYGAVWTAKGLIYVARLTNKGWELK